MRPEDEYEIVMGPILSGDIGALERLVHVVVGLPRGQDRWMNRFWITNAIDCGPAQVVKWMIDQGAPVNCIDDEGESPLLAVIDRKEPDRYEILQLLIDSGADVNAQGYLDFTPAHRAASRNDVRALKILHTAGADFSIRTRIDLLATPLEEALFLNRSPDAAAYLAGLGDRR